MTTSLRSDDFSRSLPNAQDYTTLFGLVEHYSPTGQEENAVSWLVDRMKGLGYTQAFHDEVGNAVGIMGEPGGDRRRQIVFLGHIDTVTGQVPVRLEGDLFYGRGSVDAKGPLAAFTDAVARVGSVPGWQLIVIGAVDEEADSYGARHIIPLYHPEYAIIGEPSGAQRLALGYKGSAWARLTVRRWRAHTASNVESSSEAAIALWMAVREWSEAYNQDRPRIMDQVLPTLRGLTSGQDGFQEWSSIQVGVRLPPAIPPAEWYKRLRAIVGEVEIERLGYAIPAYQAEKNTPLVRAFLAGIREYVGTPGFVVKSGTADLNLVAPAWGCPALAYGPGDSSLDHTPDEHTSLVEYSQAVHILVTTIKHLCK